MYVYILSCLLFSFFFFKQKTAYEMRISDWSSDVCSSDLKITAEVDLPEGVSIAYAGQFEYLTRAAERMKIVIPATLAIIFLLLYQIGRASCRERVCQYV